MAKKKVAIYVGRFQPFHAGHYSVYQSLVKKFGKENVYIGSSNKQDPQKSPFTFDDKKDIITTLFKVPADKVQHVKNPYAPTEILSKFPDDTIFITAVSQKDAERLGGKYYKDYNTAQDGELEGYKTGGYFVVAPVHQMDIDGENISGTTIRNYFRDPYRSAEDKVELFKKLYGKFNKAMYKKIVRQLEATSKKTAEDEPAPQGGPMPADDTQGAPEGGIDPNARVTNPLTKRDILVKTALRYPPDHPAFRAARQMFKSGKLGEIFDSVLVETELVNDFNQRVRETLVGDRRDEIMVKPTDTPNDIVKKIKLARKCGIYHYPLTHAMHINRLPSDSPDGMHQAEEPTPKKKKTETEKPSGPEQLHDQITEADSPTTRTRRYNKKNREKVKSYLRKTVKDRSARVRDRRKAEESHGKEYMKDKDVHHPDGPHGGKTQVVGKDHGPDKKNEGMLSEGGAAGHMMHPYDDRSLTFAEYKDMIEKGLVGSLGDEKPVTEKLDGQNISFSVKDGDIRFARNKGHVRGRGENALGLNDMRAMFKGRGDIERAFVGAGRDLESAMEALGPDAVRDMFREGEKFMSVEIILPETQNAIPYGKSVLVFHGTITYDEAGTATAFDPDDGKKLADQIIEVGEQKQKMFGIQGPKTIVFSDKDTKKYEEATKNFHSEIDRFAGEFSLADEDRVSEYYARWWSRELDKEAESAGIQLAPDVKANLIKRFGFEERGFRLASIPDKATKVWAAQYQKEKLKHARKVAQNPFELLFLKVGAMSLQRVESFLSANSPGAVKEIKRELIDAMTSVKAEDQSRQAEKLQYEFDRLEKVGIDKIVPTEGLVFIYKGSPYKFTGTFAPVNQLLGTFKFGGPEGPATGAVPGQQEKPQDASQRKGFIKQFYGDKITNPETGRQITIQSALTYDPTHPARKQALSYLSTRI